MDFKTRLREQIDFLGLLDKEVADKAGISKYSLDTYVGARGCMPAADVAVRLAKVLGVSVEWLITGEDARTPTADINLLYHYYAHLGAHDRKMILALAKEMYADIPS